MPGNVAAQLGALVARYPEETSSLVLVVAVILSMLFGKSRSSGGDFDFSLFDGDGDGGDGGGD